jgi:hypothetical protein
MDVGEANFPDHGGVVFPFDFIEIDKEGLSVGFLESDLSLL